MAWYAQHVCVYCGVRQGESRDHVIPRSRGGKGRKNMAPACSLCNMVKANRTPKEFMEWLKFRARGRKLKPTLIQVIEPIRDRGWKFSQAGL